MRRNALRLLTPYRLGLMETDPGRLLDAFARYQPPRVTKWVNREQI